MLRNAVLVVAAVLAMVAIAPATTALADPTTTAPMVQINWQNTNFRGTQVTIRDDGSIYQRHWSGMGFWGPWFEIAGEADPAGGITADGQTGIVFAGPAAVIRVIGTDGTPQCADGGPMWVPWFPC